MNEYLIKGKASWPLGPPFLREASNPQGRKWAIDYLPAGLLVYQVSRRSGRKVKMRAKDVRSMRGLLALVASAPDIDSGAGKSLAGGKRPVGVVAEVVYSCGGRKLYRHRFKAGCGPWLVRDKGDALSLHGGQYRWDDAKGIVDAVAGTK